MLHISRVTLDRLIDEGKIRTETYGGFTTIPASEIDKWDIDPNLHNHKLKLKKDY